MPLPNQNNKQSPINKPKLPQKSEPFQKLDMGYKKIDLIKGSWLRGGEASMYDVKKYFRRPEVRSDLRRRLKIPQNDTTQLDKHIEDMMKMIPNRFKTGVIEESEISGSEFQRKKYWGTKHDIEEKRKGGFTKPELKDIARRKEKIKYIEEKFGKK